MLVVCKVSLPPLMQFVTFVLVRYSRRACAPIYQSFHCTLTGFVHVREIKNTHTETNLRKMFSYSWKSFHLPSDLFSAWELWKRIWFTRKLIFEMRWCLHITLQGRYKEAAEYFSKAYNLSRAHNDPVSIGLNRVQFGIAMAHKMLAGFSSHIVTQNRTCLERLGEWKSSRMDQVANGLPETGKWLVLTLSMYHLYQLIDQF